MRSRLIAVTFVCVAALIIEFFAPGLSSVRPAHAAGSVTLTVNTQSDVGYGDNPTVDTKCSLREALELYSTLDTGGSYSYPDGTSADPCGSGTVSPNIRLLPANVTDVTIKFSSVTQVDIDTTRLGGEGSTIHVNLYVDATTKIPIPLTINGDLGGAVGLR